MDNFCEQLVSKKRTPAQNMLQFLLIFLTFVVGITAFFFSSTVITVAGGFIVGGAIIAGGLWGLTYTFYENEYAFTNGELDIDKIIARRKRKRLITVEIKAISDIGNVSELKGNYKKQGATLIDASDGISENTFYLDFKSQKYGNTRLLISPDDRVKDNISKYMPRHLRNKLTNEG